jgi:TRAP-type C4-dicarboxylate transport system substrate-binding protein
LCCCCFLSTVLVFLIRSDSITVQASSGRTEPLKLRLGSLGSGREDDIQRYPILAFKKHVEEQTNGMILIEHFPDGQLGQESDMMDQILTDSLDIGVLSANVLGTVWPQMYAYNLPFAFSDYEQLWEAVDINSEFVKKMTEIVDGTNLAKESLIKSQTRGFVVKSL